ncbi:hypothetical protein R50073_24230 [Maricurvus nonylphenolicus]|uniref:hypothetical protein n=1 Tax=Maricurvus nonylphenolicus TaxID=1008307 RepID=UPI0036F1BD31
MAEEDKETDYNIGYRAGSIDTASEIVKKAVEGFEDQITLKEAEVEVLKAEIGLLRRQQDFMQSKFKPH